MKVFHILTLFLIPVFTFCQANKGELRVFIENAQKLNSSRFTAHLRDRRFNEVANDTSFSQGSLQMAHIDSGLYELVLRGKGHSRSTFKVLIFPNETLELRVKRTRSQKGLDTIWGLERVSETYITNNPEDTTESGLRVFFDNIDQVRFEGCRVKVLNGRRVVRKGYLDASGFLEMTDIAEGTYEVRIKHFKLQSVRRFTVEVGPESICLLHVHFGYSFLMPYSPIVRATGWSYMEWGPTHDDKEEVYRPRKMPMEPRVEIW